MNDLIGVIVGLVLIALVLRMVKLNRDKSETKTESKGKGSWYARFQEQLLLVIPVIVVVAIGLWWLWPLHSPSLAAVRDGIWNNWFWLLIGCGIVLLVAIFKFKDDPLPGKKLQAAVWGVAVMFFIIIPLLAWITEPSSPHKQQLAHTIPLASSPQSEWPKLVIPAGGRSEQVQVPHGMRMVMAGSKFRLHTVYQDGRDCTFGGEQCPDGAVVGNYAVNEAGETIVVSYAFIPIPI